MRATIGVTQPISQKGLRTMAENKAALDLSTLAPETVDLPAVQRERAHRDNPFVQWLAETYESGTGRKVTVPAANRSEVEYLIRRAADELGIGARVVVQNSKGETLSNNDSKKAARGNVTVMFQGKQRKARKATEPESTDA